MRQALLALALIASVCCRAGLASDSLSGHRDNSGRQIAVVVPGMPHPAPVVPAGAGVRLPQLPAAAGVSARRHADVAQQPSWEPIAGLKLSNIATPVRLSPEAQQALTRGVQAAQGMSKIALKRLGDVGAWVGILCRQMNDLPRATPADPVGTPAVSFDEMRPLDEPKKPTELYFTNERRIKTVVAR